MTGTAPGAQRPLIKICGVSDTETARLVARAGADFIGLVFYPKSHRYVTEEPARAIASAAREASTAPDIKIVGLFVNESPQFINDMSGYVGLDLVQISGDEGPAIMEHLDRPIIATMRVGEGSGAPLTTLESWTGRRLKPYAVMIDAHVPGRYGGTGEQSDWDAARIVAEKYPTFLAGGLDPENVQRAIEHVKPFAVDVSTGVETNKKKDHSKISAFIDAARSASIAH